MDYTKNYHLPQWVDDDLIRRTDFNDAMASIESGLTAHQSGQDGIRDSLYRAACNNWRQLSAMSIAPWQDGVLRQEFIAASNYQVSGAPNDGTGTLRLYDGRWFANCGTAGTAAAVNATAKEISPLSYEKKSNKYVVTFTPPYPVILQRLCGFGHYSRDSSSGARQTEGCTGRLYIDATGELVKEATYTGELFDALAGSGYSEFGLWLGVPVHQGVRYRYEVQMTKDLVLPCEYGLGVGKTDYSGSAVNVFYCAGTNRASATFSGKLSMETPAAEGIALARYATYGAAGNVTLEWQGKTLTPRTVRSVTYKGKAAQEAEFLLKGPLPTESTLKLTAHCGKNGEFILYDWGATAI